MFAKNFLEILYSRKVRAMRVLDVEDKYANVTVSRSFAT